MKARVERITPKKAVEYLRQNTSNRPMSQTHAATLATMMTQGTFQENGDPIRFNGQVVLDGQHRLQAIAISGIPLNTVVVRELPGDSFKTMDRGMKRRLSHTLAIRGHKYPKHLSGVTTNILRYCQIRTYARTGADIRRIGFTDENAERFLKKHPSVGRSVSLVGPHQSALGGLVSPSMVATWHFMFTHVGFDPGDVFWEEFCTGANLPKASGRFTLRAVLTKNATAQLKMPKWRQFYYGVVALEKERVGRKITVLRLPETPPDVDGISRTRFLKDFGLPIKEVVSS